MGLVTRTLLINYIEIKLRIQMFIKNNGNLIGVIVCVSSHSRDNFWKSAASFIDIHSLPK